MGLGGSVLRADMEEVADEGVPSSFCAPGLSSSSSNTSAANGDRQGTPLLELPRDCLVRVLSFLSAAEICCVARVCRMLRAVADSDELWLPHLPFLSKKDLYLHLQDRKLHKDFSQPHWFDLATGKGCFVKSARDLKIVWGEDQRYWLWEPQPHSWFPDSACLQMVCWFEVCGEFETVFMPGTYTVSFRIRLTEELSGWRGAPVKLSLSTSNGQHVESERLFSGERTGQAFAVAPLRLMDACSWMELDAGEFHVEREMHVKLQFSMMEIEGGQWKRGVIVDCVKIQPSSALSKFSYI